MAFGFRKKDPTIVSFEEIDGVLKDDWRRTGHIDFHARSLDSASPQQLILRVEERKIIENAMGQDVVQLRWRLATLEEAKEVVARWNAGGRDEGPSGGGAAK